ncbi:MAG: TRAP transporter small permease [Cellvibrionaceae bacterium]|nr:TRAP transporter small permease [Cellvibrionaceae bacterium]
MKKLCVQLEKILATLCGILMLLMVLDVTWQVLSRYVLTNPSSFTEELARFLLIWIGLLGAAYSYRRRAHLGLDILVDKLDNRKRILADRFANFIVLLFAALVMIFGGSRIVWLTLTLEQVSPALQVQMGYVYSVIPLSGLFFCIFAVERIINDEAAPADHAETQ